MKSYIEENGLKERWHLIGNRSDIVEVMKHMDIYIGTYPWGGGLMTQIAAMCEKPIVSYIDQGERFSLIEENFLNQDHIPKLSYSNEEEFYQKIKLLVEDSERRKEEGKRLKLELISPEVFCSNLQEILEKKESRFSPEKYSVNMEQFRKLYFDIENNYLHVYDRLLLNKIMVAKRPFQTLRSLVLYLRNVDKKSLWNKFKMRMK